MTCRTRTLRNMLPSSHHLAVSLIAASLAAWPAAGSAAMPFAGTVFFGDSLTDSGYFEGYFGQQRAFTTNPDRVWAEHLAQALGGQARPARQMTWHGTRKLDGDNHAIGGARVMAQEGYPSRLTGWLIVPVADQVGAVLKATPRLDPGRLYTIWAGANDVFALTERHAQALASNREDIRTQAMQAILAGSANTAQAVARLTQSLHAAGAQTVMIANLPDMGRTPFAARTNSQSLLSATARMFNDTLTRQAAQGDNDLVALDVWGMFDEIIDHPARFGLSDVTSAACTSTAMFGRTPDSSRCTPSTLSGPDAASTHLFADEVHPTGVGHALLGDYALSVLQAPQHFGVLAEAPRLTLIDAVDAARTRVSRPDRARGLSLYTDYRSTTQQMRSVGVWQPSLRDGADLITLGAEYGGHQWRAGAAGLHAKHSATLGAESGLFRLQQTLATLYAGLTIGDWYASAATTAGYLAFPKVTRNIRLGATTLTERSRTHGTQLAAGLSTGYRMTWGDLTLTPQGGITLQRTDIDAFDESRDGQARATSMHIGSQRREGASPWAALRLDGEWRTGPVSWRPFTEVKWEEERRSATRPLSGHVRGMPGRFTRHVGAPPAEAWTTLVGVAADIGRHGQVELSWQDRRAGQDRQYAWLGSLALRF